MVGLSPKGSLITSQPLDEIADGAEDHDIPMITDDDDDSEEEEYRVKIQRNDEVNPFWIDDRDLRNGKTSFLSGDETNFWKELIEKYLRPIDKDKEKEKKQANELLALRNQMVFSFFMLNAIFVLVVFMLQQEKSMIFIRWPLGAKANVSYSVDEQVGSAL